MIPSLKWKPQLGGWHASCGAVASGSPCPTDTHRGEANISMQEVASTVIWNKWPSGARDSLWVFGSFQREKNGAPHVETGRVWTAHVSWTSAARSVSFKGKEKGRVMRPIPLTTTLIIYTVITVHTASFSGLQTLTQRMWSSSQSMGFSL